MNSIGVLIAAWLMVLGYGLFFVGFQNWRGTSVSFAQAFGLAASGTSGSQSATNPGSSSTNSGGGLSFVGPVGPGSGPNTNPIQNRSSGTQALA